MHTKIKIPEPLKPRVVLWADAGYSDMCDIDKAQSIPDLERVLCRVLQVELRGPPGEVLLALYVQTVQFCRRSGFSREQTSVLLSVMKRVHQLNTGTSLNNVEQCWDYCTELLLCHSVRRPPFSVDLLKSHEVTRILEHVNNTYMRNYTLYKYIFTPQVRLDLALSYGGTADPLPADDPPSPDREKELGETEAVGSPQATQNQETPQIPGPVEAAPGSRAALRQVVQRALSEELQRVSAQLDQSLRESCEQLNSRLSQASSQGRAQPKA
ncbi:coiled-coil domain-containing protein 189 isoform X1 [Gadus macrocephalus]|uniref:coiled-coil domain-containing protein 189 isoform X1 n=2 Tax=Gadus macrocephalus TaxID=80720 RepID=UPI0028CBB3E2|nr:coiled-coil domain-containing protein 189 isoform X1 [Gadus macrocephalus]